MTSIFKFFCASPRDLNMQTMTVEEIAETMKPTDEQTLPLPREFARAMREILKEEQKDCGAPTQYVFRSNQPAGSHLTH